MTKWKSKNLKNYLNSDVKNVKRSNASFNGHINHFIKKKKEINFGLK